MCSLTTGHISTRSHKIEPLFEVFRFPTLVPGKRAERDPRPNINAFGFPLSFPSIPYFLFLVRHHLLHDKEIYMCTPGAQQHAQLLTLCQWQTSLVNPWHFQVEALRVSDSHHRVVSGCHDQPKIMLQTQLAGFPLQANCPSGMLLLPWPGLLKLCTFLWSYS